MNSYFTLQDNRKLTFFFYWISPNYEENQWPGVLESLSLAAFSKFGLVNLVLKNFHKTPQVGSCSLFRVVYVVHICF